MSFRIETSLRSRRVGRFVARVVDSLRRAFAEEASRTGLTQAKMAEILEVDRSVINRRLNCESNLTLRTIAELAYAMGDREIVFELRERQAPVKTTRFDAPSVACLTMPGCDVKVGVV